MGRMESFGADDAQFPDVFEDSSEDESPAEASKRAADFTRASLDVTMSDDPVVLQHRLGKLQLALRSCQIQQELQQAQIQSTLSANARLRHLVSLHSSERERLAEALRLTEAEMARKDGTDRIGLAVLRGEMLEEKSRALEVARNCTRKAISDKEAVMEKLKAVTAQMGGEVRALREMNYKMREQIAQRTVLFSARQKEMEEALRTTREENLTLDQRRESASKEGTEYAEKAHSLETQLHEVQARLDATAAQLDDERARSSSAVAQVKQLQEDLSSATAAIERLNGDLEDVRSSNLTEVERAMYGRLTEEEAKSAAFREKYLSTLKELENVSDKARQASVAYEEKLTKVKQLFAGKIQRMRGRFQRRIQRISDEKQAEQKQVLLSLRAEAEAILSKANAVKRHHEELLQKEQERLALDAKAPSRRSTRDSIIAD